MGRRKLTEQEVRAAADRAEGKATPSDDPSVHPMGRPTEYKPAYVAQAKRLCELGLTEVEIADFFQVDDLTVYRWKAKYPEFCRAMKCGKELSDERVKRSLYHRAVGYTFSSEKIFQYSGEIIRAKTREHLPPDTAACSLWLRNRLPAEWRDKVMADLAVSGEVRFIVEDAPGSKPMKTIEAVADDN